MLINVILGVFAAVGVLFVLWMLLGYFLPGHRQSTVAIQCRDRDVPAVLRRYRWLHELGLVGSSLVILDCTLCEETRQRLVQTYVGVAFLTSEQWLTERGSKEIG